MTTAEIKQYIAANTPDPNIALAQAAAESNFNPNVCSPKGACGLFQFMPGTWAQYGSGDIRDPVASTQARNSYMAYLLGLSGGDVAIALGAYNAGEGRVILGYRDSSGVHHNGLVQDYGSDWLSHAPAETQGYVSRILGNAGNYQPSPDLTGQDDPGAEDNTGLIAIGIGIAVLLVWWANK